MKSQSVCFALCFFVFQLTEFTVNDRVGIVLGTKAVNPAYSIGLICTALGFLSFSALSRLIQSIKKKKVITCIIGLASIFAAAAIAFAESPILLLTASFFALFALGHIGGKFYYNAAITFANNPYTGRVIGTGMGCAVLLQFVVQNLLVADFVFVMSVAASMAVLVYFATKSVAASVLDDSQESDCKSANRNREAATIIVATVLMSLIIALIDGVVVQKHAEGSLSVSSYARLFYAFSLPAAGFVADIGNRKYMSLITVCTLFASTISSAFISTQSTFFLATACMYAYSGFYVIYFTLSFLDFAHGTKSPKLWAGMGRVVRCVVASVSTIPIVWLFNKLGVGALVTGGCALSVITLLVLFKSISISLFSNSDTMEAPYNAIVLPTKEERLQAYIESHRFTPRERDVFVKLITTEEGVQEIADDFHMSRRVLQRYISSIYEKTQTKSRIGLFQSFTDFEK